MKSARTGKSSEELFRASEKHLPLVPRDPELLESKHFGRFALFYEIIINMSGYKLI